MKYDLAALARHGRRGNQRPRTVVFRPIIPTQALAADLYGRCYKPIVTALTNALPAITASYERSLPVRDAIHDAATDDVHSVLSSIGDTLNRLVLSLAPGLSLWASSLNRWHAEKWRSATLTATGVDISTMLLAGGQPQAVGDIVNWNTRLIKDVSDQAQARISSAVFAAFQARKPVADLARELRDIVGISRARSLRIAGDQLSKLSSALDKERMDDAGIDEFKWRHSAKRHPRIWHERRDGKVYDLDTGQEVGGGDVIEPGDAPGEPPFCGCRRQAVLRI